MMSIVLKEKERAVIQDLQTQEKSCVEKYGKYAEAARDPELKNLFQNIQKQEEEHYQSLSQVLSGTLPACNCNDTQGRDYEPKASYNGMMSPEDKQHDAFLATDCIGTENWFPESTIPTFLILAKAVFANFWPISRLKNRIMPRCFISTKP